MKVRRAETTESIGFAYHHETARLTPRVQRIRGNRWLRDMILWFVVLFPLTCAAGPGPQVTEKMLDNGLKVLLIENHKAPVVTFQVWYRVGSRNEELGKTGLSHLLEHMMFKGTQKVGPEDISRMIQEAGGNINAFTSKDYTAYFETLSADRIATAMELESDRMANLALRTEDFRTEKMVVMEERRLRTDDQPTSILVEEAYAVAYQSHPYQWPTVGWMSDIEQLTVEDARRYYKRYYIPNNAFLVVVGDFQTDALFSQIQNYFGSIPKGPKPPAVRSRVALNGGERRVTLRRPARLPAWISLYHVPNVSHSDSFALEVLAAVLSSGKSSRLYRALVSENPLALEVDADYPRLSRDPGLLSVFAQVLPDKTVQQVQGAIEREMDKCKRELVNEEELQKTKNQLEASFIFGQDSLFYQAMQVARYEICGGWRQMERFLDGIRSVGPEDVRKAARTYVRTDNRTTGILLPEKPKKPAPLEQSPLRSTTVR